MSSTDLSRLQMRLTGRSQELNNSIATSQDPRVVQQLQNEINKTKAELASMIVDASSASRIDHRRYPNAFTSHTGHTQSIWGESTQSKIEVMDGVVSLPNRRKPQSSSGRDETRGQPFRANKEIEDKIESFFRNQHYTLSSTLTAKSGGDVGRSCLAQISVPLTTYSQQLMQPEGPEHGTMLGCACGTILNFIEKRLQATLAPHQRAGIAWMIHREREQIERREFRGGNDHDPMLEATSSCMRNVRGGMLCDDCGLGKTLQMIALMIGDAFNHEATEPQRRPKDSRRDKVQLPPTLVVCPKALLKQWEAEISKFSMGGLKAIVYHGAQRKRMVCRQRKDTTDDGTLETSSEDDDSSGSGSESADEEEGTEVNVRCKIQGQVKDECKGGGGSDSTGLWAGVNVVLTTYGTLAAEYKVGNPDEMKKLTKGEGEGQNNIEDPTIKASPLFTTRWQRIILDEAHTVTNRSTLAFEAVCTLDINEVDQDTSSQCLQRAEMYLSSTIPSHDPHPTRSTNTPSTVISEETPSVCALSGRQCFGGVTNDITQKGNLLRSGLESKGGRWLLTATPLQNSIDDLLSPLLILRVPLFVPPLPPTSSPATSSPAISSPFAQTLSRYGAAVWRQLFRPTSSQLAHAKHEDKQTVRYGALTKESDTGNKYVESLEDKIRSEADRLGTVRVQHLLSHLMLRRIKSPSANTTTSNMVRCETMDTFATKVNVTQGSSDASKPKGTLGTVDDNDADDDADDDLLAALNNLSLGDKISTEKKADVVERENQTEVRSEEVKDNKQDAKLQKGSNPDKISELPPIKQIVHTITMTAAEEKMYRRIQRAALSELDNFKYAIPTYTSLSSVSSSSSTSSSSSSSLALASTTTSSSSSYQAHALKLMIRLQLACCHPIFATPGTSSTTTTRTSTTTNSAVLSKGSYDIRTGEAKVLSLLPDSGVSPHPKAMLTPSPNPSATTSLTAPNSIPSIHVPPPPTSSQSTMPMRIPRKPKPTTDNKPENVPVPTTVNPYPEANSSTEHSAHCHKAPTSTVSSLLPVAGQPTDTATLESSPCSKINTLLTILRSQAATSPFSRCVIFSQWTKVLDILSRELVIHGVRLCRIDGTMSVAQQVRPVYCVYILHELCVFVPLITWPSYTCLILN